MAFRWLAKLVGRNSDSETPGRKRQKTFDDLFARRGLFRSVRPLSFFLTQLSEAQINLLEASGVSCEATQIKGRDGVLVKNIRKSSSILSPLDAELLAHFPSGSKGITEVLLLWPRSDEQQEHRLTISNWSGENCAAFEALIRQNLLPFLGCDIELSVPHNDTRAPVNDKVFHIYVWSSPVARGSSSTPDEMFGIPVDCRDESFYPSRTGILIKDESGNAIAELISNCLYIHHDLVHYGTYNELGIFYRILQIVRHELDFITELEQHCANLEVECSEESRYGLSASGTKTEALIFGRSSGRLKNERTEKIFALLLESTIFPLVNTPFQVECGNAGEPVFPKIDGLFHIHLWSSPMGVPVVPVPKMIFARKAEHGSFAFLPSGKGVPIIENGYAVAELLEKNLYIHHRMRDFIDRDACFMLLEIFRRVRHLLIRNSERGGRDGRSYQISAFTDDQLSPLNAIARALRSSTTSKQQYEAARGKLESAIRVTASGESSLLRLKHSPLESLGKEFDDLLTVPQVRSIRFKDHALLVSTTILYCKNPSTHNIHEIGAFEISIPLDTSQPILWFNHTRRVDGHHRNQNAPHIWSDGTACLGNAELLLSELRGKRDLAGVVIVAIAFVESVNLSDRAGKYIYRWPVVRQ